MGGNVHGKSCIVVRLKRGSGNPFSHKQTETAVGKADGASSLYIAVRRAKRGRAIFDCKRCVQQFVQRDEALKTCPVLYSLAPHGT